MSNTSPSIKQLQRAIQITEHIGKLEAELKAILGSIGGVTAPGKIAAVVPRMKKKRTMSPEARARIVAGQKARWAKIKGEKATAFVQTEAKPDAAKTSKRAKKTKRSFSREARAKMAAAAKKRWAKVKNAKV